MYHTELLEIDPQLCKPWPQHYRDRACLSRQRCADLIRSIDKEGQIEPVIARVLEPDSPLSFEIIAGVRRWFACSQIPNKKLLARIIEADDRTCIILMHAENSNFRDMTDFERACAFAAHMKSGAFKNQMDLAKTMRISEAKLSKMIKVAEMFEKPWFSALFDNKLDILVRQTYKLSTLLKKPGLRLVIEAEAEAILAEKNQPSSERSARLILQRLIHSVKAKSLG